MIIDMVVKITPLGIALLALFISWNSYKWSKNASKLTGDNNIIAYVTTVLTLLERVKNLGPKEQEIFKKLLTFLLQ